MKTTTTPTTIVYFHTGRGGHFNNPGHKSFGGLKNIQDILNIESNHSFPSYENYRDIYNMVKERELNNLLSFFEECRDNEDYTPFEKRTKLSLGEEVYTDQNGNFLIKMKEAATGVGTLNWDGAYNTDTCLLLSDCDEQELRMIHESNEFHYMDSDDQAFILAGLCEEVE